MDIFQIFFLLIYAYIGWWLFQKAMRTHKLVRRKRIDGNHKAKLILEYVITFIGLLWKSFIEQAKKNNSSTGSGSQRRTKTKAKQKPGANDKHLGVKLRSKKLPLKYLVSSGNCEVLYDGSRPTMSSQSGNIRYYTTNGNLQVFFLKEGADKKFKFDAATVEEYRVY